MYNFEDRKFIFYLKINFYLANLRSKSFACNFHICFAKSESFCNANATNV